MITGRRVVLQSLISLLIVFSALIFVYPLRYALSSHLDQRLGGVITDFEESLSGVVTYDSISPMLFNRIALEGVSFTIPGSTVSAQQLVIQFSLREVYTDYRNLTHIDISLRGLSGTIDVDELIKWIAAMETGLISISSVGISLDDAQLDAELPEWQVSAGFAEAEILVQLEQMRISGSVTAPELNGSGALTGTLLSKGIIQFSLSEEHLFLQIPDMYADIPQYGSMDDVPLLAIWEDSTLYISSTLAGTAVIGTYTPDQDNSFTMNISSDALDTGATFRFYALPDEISQIIQEIQGLEFSADVTGRLTQDPIDFSDLKYEAEFRLAEFTYQQLKLSFLQGRITGDMEGFTNSQLQTRIQDNPVRFQGDISFTDLVPEGRLDIRITELLDDRVLSLDVTRLGERQAGISYDQDEFSLAGSIDYRSFDELLIYPTLTYGTQEFYLPMLFIPEERYISSLDGGDARFSLDMQDGTTQVMLNWQDMILPALPGVPLVGIPVSGRLAGYFTDLDDYRFTIQSLQIDGIALMDHEFGLSMEGSLTPGMLRFTSITYRDEQDMLNGSGSLLFDAHSRTIRSALIEFRDGQEHYRGELFNYDGFYHLAGTIDSGSFDRFQQLPFTGTVNSSISIYGVPDQFTGEIDIDVPELDYRGNIYQGTLSVLADRNGFTISQGGFSVENIYIEDIRSRYDVPSGSFDLSLDLIFDAGDMLVTSRATSKATLPSIDRLFDLLENPFQDQEIFFDFQLLDVSLGELVISDQMDFMLLVEDNQMVLSGGDQDELFSLEISSLEREFALSLYEGLPIQLRAEGSWAGGGLFTFHAQDISFDLTFLNILGIPNLNFAEGTIEGYLSVMGSLQDPDFYGELSVDTVKVDLDYLAHQANAHNVSLTIHGKEMNFSLFNTMVDTVPVRTKLDFYIENWIPLYFDMHFSVPPNRFIRSTFTIPGAQVEYDALVTGEMQIVIDNYDTYMTGNLTAEEGQVSFSLEEFPVPDNPLPVRGELNLITGRSLQFILPTREFPILTANALPQQKVNIVFDNSRRTFSITGNVGLKSGEIYYVRRNFYITEGSIQLAETHEFVDPMINVRARIREYDQQANRVDIYLVAENQRLNSLTPRFESNPPMQISEIAQILGESILISEQAGGRGSISPAIAFASLATDIINQFGLIDQLSFMGDFETNIRNALNLDVFSIRSQIVHNALVLNLPDTQVENPIASFLDNTTVFLGKYLGDSMFFQTMLVLSENVDQEEGSSLFFTDYMNMDVELSFEWQTPLYELVITTQPKLNFPGLFSDFSVGLSWRYSF